MSKKVDTPTAVAVPTAAILVQFFWNHLFPDWQMGTEVAVAAGALVGGFARWAVGAFVSERPIVPFTNINREPQP